MRLGYSCDVRNRFWTFLFVLSIFGPWASYATCGAGVAAAGGNDELSARAVSELLNDSLRKIPELGSRQAFRWGFSGGPATAAIKIYGRNDSHLRIQSEPGGGEVVFGAALTIDSCTSYHSIFRTVGSDVVRILPRAYLPIAINVSRLFQTYSRDEIVEGFADLFRKAKVIPLR
jgi:hypothetical protein